MEQKRKISVRRILQVFVTIVVTGACVLAMLSASKMQDTRTVNKMQITIRNEKSCGFLDKAQLQDMLINSRHIDLEHTPIARLNLHAMEQIMLSNAWVASAEVYVDNVGTLLVYVTQSVPVLRVFQQDTSSYYLDKNLKTLPLSERYTHYAPVVTNVPVLKDDSVSTGIKMQLLKIVSIISADTFWSAQVAEINMMNDRRFQLIPVLGNHRILIGDTSMLRVKLDNVFAFYQQVLNRIGWDKYQLIDASFKGQVVASPAIKLSMPKDRAVMNGGMDWVKTVMGNAPVESIGTDSTVTQTVNITPVIKPVVQAIVKPQQPARQVATPIVKPKETGSQQRPVISAKTIDNKPKPADKKTVPGSKTPAKQQTTSNQPKPIDKKQADIKKTVTNNQQPVKTNTEPKKTESDNGQPKPKYIYPGN